MSDSDPNMNTGYNTYHQGSGEDELSAGWQANDFDLLEFVGVDGSPFDIEQGRDEQGHDLDDETMQKDQQYSALQYNNVMLNNDVFDNYGGQPFEQHTVQPFAYHPENNVTNYVLDNPHLPSTSRNSGAVNIPIKVEKLEQSEMVYEQDDQYSNNGHNEYTGSEAGSYIDNKPHPRKYRIKPDCEKKNPTYRAKREKNNDAVRRSRDKAKKEQERRDYELNRLQQKAKQDESKIKALTERAVFLEAQLVKMKRICKCGAGSGR